MSKRTPPPKSATADRRTILKLSALGVGAIALGVGGCADGEIPDLASSLAPGANPDDAATPVTLDVDAVAVDTAVFAYAVQSGDATKTSALLWTHTTSPEVTLRVWRDSETAGEILQLVERPETPDATGLIRTTVEGLSPGAVYRFAFFDDVDGAQGRSPIGTVRAAFDDETLWPLTVGAATCTNWDHRPYEALSLLAEEDFDVFIHLGDMSYNDGATTVAEYGQKWRETLSDPGYQAVLPRASLLMSWDDHEFRNDLNPETADPAQVAAAKTSFFEHLAVRPGPDQRLWQSHQWGDTVEFITLDARTERLPSTRRTDASVYIGLEQMAFFKERLKNSTAQFKVVLNSVPITQMTDFWGVAGDRWQGYGSQREEILDFLVAEDIKNVFFLSGDFHVGFVGRVEGSGPRSQYWEIAVGPTGNLGNPLAGLLEIDPFEYGPLIFPEEQFRYGRGIISATTLTFNPISGGVRVKFIAAEDREVLFDEVIRGVPLPDAVEG